MTFEEIAQLVATAEPPPEYMCITDQLCYQSLSILLERHMAEHINQEQAAVQKHSVKLAFSTSQNVDKLYAGMFETYQTNILAASSLMVAITKSQDKTAGELFSMAVQCISKMTGDTVFLKNISKVQPTMLGGGKGA